MALSTTEAEYIACTAAACQIVWIRRVMQECGVSVTKGAISLWCDNLSTIAIAKNPSHHGRTKHVDVRFHFIRNLVNEGVILLIHCRTDEKLADMFTKPLPVEKHLMMRKHLGLCTLQSRGGVEA